MGNRMVIYGGYGGTSDNMPERRVVAVARRKPGLDGALAFGRTALRTPVSDLGVQPDDSLDGDVRRRRRRQRRDVTDLAWSLSLSGSPAWNEIGGRSMPRTDGATAIFDPIRGRLVTFGGRPSQTYTNEVWMYDLVGNWTQLTPTGTPPAPRTGHTTIYDPVRDRMLVYGGTDSVNTYGDVWALSLSGSPAWTHVVTNGGPPVARFQHVAVYDSQRDRMVVHGGGGPGDTGEMWALNLSTNTWTSVIGSPSGPGFRQDHVAVYDPINDRIVMFGGTSDDALWSVNFSGTPTWSQLAHNGTPPLARSGMAAVYDAPAHSMLIFGGSEAASYDSVE